MGGIFVSVIIPQEAPALDIIVNSDDANAMRYPGGKGKCYQHLINLMPPHRVYIESHLGGGAVMRNKKTAVRNIGIDLDPSVIARWEQESLSESCELLLGDAVAFFEAFNFQGDELVYADPPYLTSTRRRERIYTYEYTEKDHERLLDALVNLPCKVMLSGYDSPLYNSRLSGWRKETFYAKTHVNLREECVWLNFPKCDQLHDARYFGSSYRERQSVQRRQERLRSRIERMNPIERSELFRWMEEAFGSAEGIN